MLLMFLSQNLYICGKSNCNLIYVVPVFAKIQAYRSLHIDVLHLQYIALEAVA